MTLKLPDKYRKVITRFVFPLLLTLYSFIGVREGVDIVDATFSMTGFVYPDKMNAMWRFAYYLSNVIGSFFTRLPGGDTLAGMNAYGSAIIALTALTAYFGLLRLTAQGTNTSDLPPGGKVATKWSDEGTSSCAVLVHREPLLCAVIIFLAELIAISLTWAPRTSLYNYLTYLFMTVGVVLLLSGLRRNPYQDCRSDFADRSVEPKAHAVSDKAMTHDVLVSTPQQKIAPVPDKDSDAARAEHGLNESAEAQGTVPLCNVLVYRGPSSVLFLILAGIIFGLNVHVRFPNITQAVFILVVWLDAWRKKEALSAAVKKTLACIAGYAIGFGIPFLVIVSRYGIGAYGQMLSTLFGMTGDAQDYSAGGMLTAIFTTYATSIVRMWPVWVAIVAGIIIELILPKSRVIYGLLFFAALFFMYKSNFFTRSYWYYDSIFEPAMMFIILGVIVCGAQGTVLLCNVLMHREPLPCAPGRTVSGATGGTALCASAALLIILITPLGSNNYTYPIINNLFFAAPTILSMAFAGFVNKEVGSKHDKVRTSGGGSKGATSCFSTVLTTALACVTALLLFQGLMFHTHYAFNDGMAGTPRDTVITAVPRAYGMKTTSENAAALTSLYEELASYRAAEAQTVAEGGEPEGVIMFGRAPGIPYLMEIEPAIFTTWPDLDTISAVEFRQALYTAGFPLIIVRKDPFTEEPIIMAETHGQEKWEILQEFMQKKVYVKKPGTEGKTFAKYYDVYISYASSRAPW